jgi:hypothetical protein
MLPPAFHPRGLLPEAWFNFFISLVSPLSLLSKFSGKNLNRFLTRVNPIIMRPQVDLGRKSADLLHGCRIALLGAGNRTASVLFQDHALYPLMGEISIEWSGGTDRTLGIKPDGFFGELELIPLEDKNPSQERRTQSSQDAQDLQGLEGSHDSR